MYKKQKSLKTFLSSDIDNDELFSRSSMNTIIRAMLEPVANQNANCLIFTRFKNKDGVSSLIKRLEYCNNVEMIDVTASNTLIKDDYIELEFVIFTSPRYNFVLIWDYSIDKDKDKTRLYFLANTRRVNDIYEILQENLKEDYREKFYLHKPERRENELLNDALANVLKKLNNSIEENLYKESDTFVDLTNENDFDEKIKETSHEIKNQLSVLDVYIRVLEKTSGKNKNLDIMKKAVENIKFQLNVLRNYEADDIKQILIQDIIEQSVETFKEVLAENNNKIEYIQENYDIYTFADENKLISVLNNLIKNANESTKNDTIEIKLQAQNGFCTISVINHGNMIDLNNQKHVFDKGFTTKRKGDGTGLYVSRQYIEKFKGELNLVRSDSELTEFEIKLPMNFT